jgi:hypothetical protein
MNSLLINCNATSDNASVNVEKNNFTVKLPKVLVLPPKSKVALINANFGFANQYDQNIAVCIDNLPLESMICNVNSGKTLNATYIEMAKMRNQSTYEIEPNEKIYLTTSNKSELVLNQLHCTLRDADSGELIKEPFTEGVNICFHFILGDETHKLIKAIEGLKTDEKLIETKFKSQ